MTSDLLERLEGAVRAADRRLTDARELLWHVEGEAQHFNEVVERQKTTVGHLQAAVEAGRAVLAGAVRLGGNLEAAVAGQETEAAPVLAELEHTTATAEQQALDEGLVSTPAAPVDEAVPAAPENTAAGPVETVDGTAGSENEEVADEPR